MHRGERIRLEGATVTVCKDCASMGTRVGPAYEPRPVERTVRRAPARRKPEEEIVPECASRVHQARERLGITQKELADRLNEKESVITRIEAGRMVPPMSLARRIERKLEITLVAVLEEEDVGPLKSHDAPLTLGDVVKVRKRG